MPFIRDEIILDWDMRITIEPVGWFRKLPGVRSWFPNFTGDRPSIRIKFEDVGEPVSDRSRVIPFQLACKNPGVGTFSRWAENKKDDQLATDVGGSVQSRGKMLTETGHYALEASIDGKIRMAVGSIPVVSRATVLVGVLYVLVSGFFTLLGGGIAVLAQWIARGG